MSNRILEKLDEYLGKNDYDAALKYLLYWHDEFEKTGNNANLLMIKNELMGLYRKLGKKDEAMNAVSGALSLIGQMGIEDNVGAATTYLNSGTVYKAFSQAEKALPLFNKALEIYESSLPAGDKRFGGLYNNMALALIDCGKFPEAYSFYQKAIDTMSNIEDGGLEVAITYLNIANAKETEKGALDAEGEITELLEKAMALLDSHKKRDGYYAFVCDKCASVFGYFGYFLYEKELESRARSIYEGA